MVAFGGKGFRDKESPMLIRYYYYPSNKKMFFTTFLFAYGIFNDYFKYSLAMEELDW